MKKQALIAVLTLAIGGTALAAGNHDHDDHAPRHGGVVAAGKEADYELVAKADTLQLYLSDHGKPMDTSKAAARLTLLAGSDKTEVELKPAGDRLEARGSFKVTAGTKVVAVVSNAGKTLGTARFTLK
ncbi:hypothetical protein QTH87_21435 [Variovorax sp. J22P168]|uniref:hypothetical protein n=1 Tax=Variovorax jilinensis TaxID=3053513 RepID=UPI0025762E3D|nr:hypothetical protein [Variovorax sp. J22P168]MDM0015023.1 hypothetical protein [Variovorax sp. J22P168]